MEREKQDNKELDLKQLLIILTAVKNGDFKVRMPNHLTGQDGKIADTLNEIIDANQKVSTAIEKISDKVGKSGKLSQRVDLKGLNGSWGSTINSVNSLIDDLSFPLIELTRVIGSVSKGDLTQLAITEFEGRAFEGDFLRSAKILNSTVEQIAFFTAEVNRVSREVGIDGKLGGQAQSKDFKGSWKELTDNVNSMANNLTAQVRNIAEVTIAVADGDLSKKIMIDVRGEFLQLKDTINTMVDQLRSFASEVSRVAKEVGSEGKLGGQAIVPGVGGVWKEVTDNVNGMASNLTAQVRNITKVTTAIAKGDLASKITVEVSGEMLELKSTINTMVDLLNGFAGEVIRVAREVGSEGLLGGQASVPGIAGIWKELTDSVNSMASNLTNQVRNIAEVTTAVANGDLARKITVDARGEIMELKNTVNTMVDQLNLFAGEVTRVAKEVGTEGKLGGQAQVKGISGTWKDLTDNVNSMGSNLTSQVRNIAAVTTAVAKGDLTRKITVDVSGEMQELKLTINTMVDQLNSFASEVTRVAKEVGTDGKLGGQAVVTGISGTWKDLTDSVNLMASNLTDQVRGIAKVVTGVANGDLRQKLTVPAKGEIASLSDTINNMIDTLDTFSEQVIGVAKEVGVDGKLGGQASVPGAAGTWKNLVDNVNQLAGNLTTQVRAIADVAISVTKGDLTRTIQVEARGEMDELKNNLNEMIRTLKVTTETNTDQDWLKTNLAKFTKMLQGQRDLKAVSNTLLTELAPLVNASHGVFYNVETTDGSNKKYLKLLSSYAFKERKNISSTWNFGEGLVGQCAFEKQRILLTNVPNDYVQITSGLGASTPLNIIILPVLFEGDIKAVIELASFNLFSKINQVFLDQLMENIGIVLNTIEANTKTEELLKKSQSLAEELGSQQEELRQTNEELESQQEELKQTNEELEDKAKLLTEQKAEVDRKNSEVEQAKQALEEKAEQLTLTSKYKSEFLSNMSHELRTPLNSLLILSNQLKENQEGNLTEKQVKYAGTIHSAGDDLLNLINEILDLSKIESGTVSLDLGDVSFSDLQDQMESTFRHVAQGRNLKFKTDVDPNLPAGMYSDTKRIQQVLKNLLSNAFKFTEKGSVTLRMYPAMSGWSYDKEALNNAKQVVAFEVNDTGIGIAKDKLKIIFEAFQQADGSTSRKYGGTGLGLSISREIAHLLGGEIKLTSEQGKGSTFILYLPVNYSQPGGKKTEKMTASVPSNPGFIPEKLSFTQKPKTGSKLTSSVFAESALYEETADDRNDIAHNDKVLLIVEDDPKFMNILTDIGHEKGFKVINTSGGNDALSLTRQYKPDAITLDINLPDVDGWTILDRIKLDPDIRHIPVQIITVEEEQERGYQSGALTYLTKPVKRDDIIYSFDKTEEFISRKKRLLIVEDEPGDQETMVDLLKGPDIEIIATGSGEDALKLLKESSFDCIVLDLYLPGMSGFDFLDQLRKDPALIYLPVVVYSAKDLTRKEEALLKDKAKSAILKDEGSADKLFDETSLFLHRVTSKLPANKRKILEKLYKSDAALKGKKVLLVDDDVRNIFSLTSVLEGENMIIYSAENGKDALRMLNENPDVDIVLMDVMMPEMDGYETTRAIRKNKKFKNLPIVALTAKAMKGDREKCIDAGASDYITKPVDTHQLISLMKVWLFK